MANYQWLMGLGWTHIFNGKLLIVNG